MQHGITRRDFLRYSAATLGALWLGSVLPGASKRVQAAAFGTPMAPPSFDALPNPAVLGAPVDVAIGTDGVTWITSAAGAPSTYDPVGQAWTPFGGGIDAVAYVPYRDNNGNYLVAVSYFRGGEVFQAGQVSPVAIAERWQGPPGLPPSFQTGIDGAVNFANNNAVLFRQGQAAFVLAGGGVAYTQSLASFSGWPDGDWAGGNFDYVISGQELPDAQANYVYFVLGSKFVTVELFSKSVYTGPAPLADFYQGVALSLLTQPGNQAVLVEGQVQDPTAALAVYRGPLVYGCANATSTAAPQITYIAQQDAHWPAAWHPVLNQAPAGSIGNLWAVTQTGIPLVNDGSDWNPAPLPSQGVAIAVDAGTDGSVCAISSGALYRLDATTGSWSTAATTTQMLRALSVGASDAVWVSDNQGTAYQYDSVTSSLVPVALGVAVTDIKANQDSTLWHCDAGQGNVYRYLIGGKQPPEQINIGQSITSVVKTTSSSFGTGLFLAQQNGQAALIRYTSPYVFKTANAYWTGAFPTIAVGAASVFLTLPATVNHFRVVALDMQTGAERWSYPYFDQSDGALSPLYDANHQLVYAFSTLGNIYALDAATGLLRWTTELSPVLPVAPVLSGGLLLFSCYDSPLEYPNSQKVYVIAIDTLAAVQAAASNQPIPVRWQFATEAAGQQPAPTSVVAANGTIYCAVWSDPDAPLLDILQVNAASGVGGLLIGDFDTFTAVPNAVSQIAPLIAPINLGSGQLTPAFVFAGPDALYAMALDGSGNYVHYTNGIGATNPIVTNLMYYAGVIYAGDLLGNVHAVDANFAAVAGSPYAFSGGSMTPTLAVAPDSSGSAILILADGAATQLDLYFTSSATMGNLATNQTWIGAMSAVTAEGMIYVGGGDGNKANNLGQIFGIRTSALNTLRDFIIESQLMQDYALGAIAAARYQTHVTIVDDTKTPRPNVDIKLWADETQDVIVAGQTHTIGPDAPLATQVDASGTLTIISDASDLFATALRLWAVFMDPFERIVIYPDQEFHARLPNMTADPTNDDPTTINLATGTNYGGTKVFTDQTQAQAVASAVSLASSKLGLGNTNASGLAMATTEPPYIAYADLVGIQYFAANTPSTRQPVPQGTLGLALNLNGADEFVVMGFADAAAQIDALQGAADPRLLGFALGSWFSHLWHDIKKGVAAVAKVVVSVANSIYIGLTYVVDGVTYVIQHVVQDIEDVASLIGVLFIKLGKYLQDVIELLSLLLHFDKILDTYHWLKPALLGQVNALTQVIPGLEADVQAFFATAEHDIEKAMCTLKKQVDPSVTCGSAARTPRVGAASQPVSSFGGVGSSPHTIFTVGAKGGGPTASHAVHATWGLHKVKDHYKQATAPSAARAGGDPLADYFSGFVTSLSSNAELRQAFDGLQSDFAANVHVKSASDFLQMAIVDLIDIMELLLVGSLAVSEALIAGMFNLAQAMVSLLVDPNDGLLTQPLDIPIISDLFALIVRDDLTFFNLIVLVAAIPITIIYRIVEGAWPGDQLPAGASSEAPAQVSMTAITRVFGLFELVCYVGNGFFAPAADMFVAEDETPMFLSLVLIGLSIGTTVPSTYGITDHAEAVNLVGQIWQVVVNALGDQEQVKAFVPAVLMVCGIVVIATYIVEKVNNDADWIGFSADFLGEIPNFVRPIQYLAQEFPIATTITLATIDMLVNFATAGAEMIGLMVNWDKAAPPTDLPPSPEPPGAFSNRAYLPFAPRAR